MPEKSVANSLDQLPEVFVSDQSVTKEVSRAVKAGKLRKLASRLYTHNLTDPVETLISRNLWQIVAGYFPGALIADRTALENAPASDGSVCLVTGRAKTLNFRNIRFDRAEASVPLPPTNRLSPGCSSVRLPEPIWKICVLHGHAAVRSAERSGSAASKNGSIFWSVVRA